MKDEIQSILHECFIRKTLSDLGAKLIRDFVTERNHEDDFEDPNRKSVSYLTSSASFTG